MSDRTACGVLVVAHGTVENLDDLPEFLRRIRQGRPVTRELARELRRRYEAIGGSPLLTTTRRQAHLLAQRLNLPTYMSMRFWEPTVDAALVAAASAGVQRLVVLPLAPFSVAVYSRAVRAAAAVLAARGAAVPELVDVMPWGSHDALVAAHCAAIATHSGTRLGSAELILTAHSLPARMIEAGDRYAVEVEASASAIARRLGIAAHLAYQSQGAEGGAWLGPTLEDTLKRLAGHKARGVVVAPVGFLADHVETLFDLEIEARAQATELGLAFHRVPALNDGDALIDAASEVVEAALDNAAR